MPTILPADLDFVEVNFDGLVGPTHNYAGLSRGNLASAKHSAAVSHPRQAALQGLAKIKLLCDLEVPQAILPPQPRPCLRMLRMLGFDGSDSQVVSGAHREAPRLLAAVYSSSFMWAANAATISPAVDAADGRMHITPANLLTQFHRSIETAVTADFLQELFSGELFEHHVPLPAADAFADEGAANHFRICDDYGAPGLEVFVYGRDEVAAPSRFPARQTRQACEAIARRHRLDPARRLILQQSPEAIDAGAFHNDVVLASNQNVVLAHASAFADPDALNEIRRRSPSTQLFVADAKTVSLADAVSTYIFNSQIVTLPNGTMCIIAPIECQEHLGVQRYLAEILASNSPIKSIHYVDLRQSMNNGGGPACLRLRVVLPAPHCKSFLISKEKLTLLEGVINHRYRDELSLDDLADPSLITESQAAVEEIRRVLRLP